MMVSMRWIAPVFAAGLVACGGGDARPDDDANAPISQSDRTGYQMACRSQAVLQGAEFETADALCTCIVDRLAEGRTAAEFDAIPAAAANEALESCMGETQSGSRR